ncbi:LytTR family DNA-binding domain-containing protein [Spirosoma montaniterrae]|uniref:Histidine kinase n=1 Tax=Spirosoma montaniterrae TaxID=1178516 RepID=A0A1P9X2L9_9BACT|nr:LytTR family DNA-binding domain-containing protein [Spirosoma montaniterrae]AQG81876.1 histidine kinase [Spirosoma montaniterrae]
MKEIRINRQFLRDPLNGVLILIGMIVLIEAVSWSIGYNIKVRLMAEAGGFMPYVGALARSMILPELFTFCAIIFLLNLTHAWFKIDRVANKWKDIARYQLFFLPVLLVSFPLFNPVTQTIRYVMEQFPTYSFKEYWQSYIVYTFSWAVYFKYLFPVTFMGYVALNMSLLKDYLQQRKEAQEAAQTQADQVTEKAIALMATIPQPPTNSNYLAHLKGKGASGELDFPVNDVYYFTIEDRFYYAELAKGRYLVGKTLNELETELDPAQFMRIKRDYIVNRHAVMSYAYWENGKYIVRLNTPDNFEIVVPRARMHEFREWLQGNARLSGTDPAPGSLVLAPS